MVEWPIVTLIVAAGCGRIGFDPLGKNAGDGALGDDGIAASDTNFGPTCAGVAFGVESEIPGFSSPAADYDPSERSDHLEMWLSGFDGFHFDVFSTVRATTGTTYPTQTSALFNLPSSDEEEPSLTSDGLELFFISTRTGQSRVFVVTRADFGSAFGAPTIPVGLEAVDADSVDISGDDRTLYIHATGGVTSARRAARGAPFSAPIAVPGIAGYSASISRDELEVYSTVSGSVYRQTRATVADAFGAMELITTGTYPAISFDQTELVYANALSLFRRTRTCP